MTRQEPLSGKGVGLYPGTLEHILHVNGQYKGEDDLGKLMHDFLCNDPDDMEVSGDGSNGSYLRKSDLSAPASPRSG